MVINEKRKFKKTLIRSYIKNVDYIISKNKLTTADRPSETILISISCFTPLKI